MGDVVSFKPPKKLSGFIPEQPVCGECISNGDGGYICRGGNCAGDITPMALLPHYRPPEGDPAA